MTPDEIWEKIWIPNFRDAEFDRVDRVDDYCWECNISLEVDGYKFGGYGTDSCGNHEIEYLECVCPDGSTVKLV